MKRVIFLLFVSVIFFNMNGQKERDQIDDRYKWDLTHICASDEAWKEAKNALVSEMDRINSFKGTLTGSAGALLKALEFDSNIRKEMIRLNLYAIMKSDEDTRNMKYLGMKQEIQQIMSDYSAKKAYMKPEILAVEWPVIQGFFEDEPSLAPYRRMLGEWFRLKAHTPGEAEGRIVALSGMVSGVPSSVYSTFKNAEMPNPEVTLSNGEKVILDSPGYARYRALPDREDRALVFESFFRNLEKYQATLGGLLYGGVKKDVFNARARNYSTALEAALDLNNIPTEVYHALIENVNKNLDAFHRYLKIKKRIMGVDTLRYMDLYAPVMKDVDLSYGFDEVREILIEALAPLGKEYVSTVEKAFSERWIDVYPSPGKRSGAYSEGDYYDGHPYILLNYNDQYDDVSTTAHELGHTMQSYYSNRAQPFPTAEYTIFVAEVASTFNEVLLFEYIMERINDDDTRLSLLMTWLDSYRLTLFRQTQFAEFELKIHEAVEKGIPLTGAYLSDLYYGIVKKYYGHDQGVCLVDDYIHMEWAYIPHFYLNYYVYQYSTSFTASISLARQLLDGADGASERYIEFLSAGSSDDPITLLRNAGVDMTGSGVFTSTIAAMNDLMDRVEEILDRKETLP